MAHLSSVASCEEDKPPTEPGDLVTLAKFASDGRENRSDLYAQSACVHLPLLKLAYRSFHQAPFTCDNDISP